MKFFLDSSAWLEYFEGSFEGEKVHKILKGNNDIYSLNLIVSEVVSKVKRENQDENLAFRAISSNSKILEINPKIAKEAGVFHAEMKKKKRDFGLVDSIIWIVCKELNAKLVTKDFHFKNFKNLVFLK